MIESPVFNVTENGIKAPSYAEILEYFQEKGKAIFGQDVDLDADTQDGQLIAIFAQAISDVNAQAIATYNQFNPNTAVGVGLDSAVKTNGIERHVATNSTVDLVLIGQAGTVIDNGIASDDAGTNWLLPDWQSVNNPNQAVVGVAVETDAQLRTRQARSTELASVSLWEGIVASLLNLEGVTRVSGVKNDEDEPSQDGIPGHTIAMIVDGGDVDEIGKTIFLKKGEGVGTYGTTNTTYIDSFGFPNVIRFSRPTIVNVYVTLTITPSSTYISTVADEIKQRIADYINGLAIGESVNIARVLSNAVKDCTTGVDDRFDVTAIVMGEASWSQTAASIPIEWNEAASCDVDQIAVTLNE